MTQVNAVFHQIQGGEDLIRRSLPPIPTEAIQVSRSGRPLILKRPSGLVKLAEIRGRRALTLAGALRIHYAAVPA